MTLRWLWQALRAAAGPRNAHGRLHGRAAPPAGQKVLQSPELDFGRHGAFEGPVFAGRSAQGIVSLLEGRGWVEDEPWVQELLQKAEQSQVAKCVYTLAKKSAILHSAVICPETTPQRPLWMASRAMRP